MEQNKSLSDQYQALCEARAEEIRKANLTIEDQVLQEFNNRYAIVHTKSTYILIEKEEGFVLDTKASLLLLHENDQFINSQGKVMNKATFWLKHPDRRNFSGIVFNPACPGHYSNKAGCQIYNIFSGFSIKPVSGDCSLFWAHVHQIICSGDHERYRYVRKWMSCVVQRPKILATALVLRGLQGTGKTIFVSAFGHLFGRYFLTVTNLDQIVGRFNSHLQYAYLINANEAIWGGHKKEIGALKALITDPTIFIEAKGKDGFTIDNCRHLLVTSNEDWAVPRDLDDRRFFVLDVSSSKKGDHEYFAALDGQLRSGGYEALLYDLLNEDLIGFDPRVMPVHGTGFDMKIRSASSSEQYIFQALRCKAWNIHALEGSWEFLQEKPTGDLFDSYREWCNREGLRHQTTPEFGATLKKLIPSMSKTRPTIGARRIYCYSFPSLEICRKEFQAFVKEPDSIWEED